MSADRLPRAESFPRSRWSRLGILLAGIFLTQAILYGPSLLGRKIMLPVDLLALPGVYLPQTPETARIVPHDLIVSDLIYSHEMERRFAHAEIAAGRLPLWHPYEYCGSPNIWPWLSPIYALAWSTASPVVWAWVHLLEALVAGLGAYLFFRHALGLSFWAAVVPAWCYPLTGFFVLWQGNPTSGAAFWLPWLLLAVDRVASAAGGRWIAGLAGATGLVLVGGNLDVSGQCLLASGLFALWKLLDLHGRGRAFAAARRAALRLAGGWALGFMLAAPYWLPVLEYSQSGSRMARRGAGEEERPPVGLAALPQTVVPDMNGATRKGSLWLARGNQVESSAAAYAGLVATLFLAPLAACSARHRRFAVFAAGMSVLGLAWCLDLPGFVAVLRLPLLNMMSHNRLVFVTAFFVLGLAAVGFEVLRRGEAARRPWFWLPAGVVAVLGLWCVARAVSPPEPVASQVLAAVNKGNAIGWVRNADDVAQLRAWFGRAYGFSAGLCLLALTGWLLVWRGRAWSGALLGALGVTLVGDMVWFAHGRTAQSDPALYFPRLEFFDRLAELRPGRVLGYACLPATLAQAVGLRDVRGYDGVDPLRLVELLELAAQPEIARPTYALTQWFQPRADVELPGSLKLPPVLDLLGVTHLIFRGEPVPRITPALRGHDYWALANPRALPRAFVPARVEAIADRVERLRRLGAADFDPRAVAFAEEPVTLPASCRGEVVIAEEIPRRVRLNVDMATPGLVVLADLWDKGWAAYLDGKRVPVLRVDHALRGVVVPAGKGTLEFRYEPARFRAGVWLAGLALAIIGGVGAWGWSRARRRGA